VERVALPGRHRHAHDLELLRVGEARPAEPLVRAPRELLEDALPVGHETQELAGAHQRAPDRDVPAWLARYSSSARRSASPSDSNPSGIRERLSARSSWISLRGTTCRVAVASISSIAVRDSPTRRPLRLSPSCSVTSHAR